MGDAEHHQAPGKRVAKEKARQENRASFMQDGGNWARGGGRRCGRTRTDALEPQSMTVVAFVAGCALARLQQMHPTLEGPALLVAVDDLDEDVL